MKTKILMTTLSLFVLLMTTNAQVETNDVPMSSNKYVYCELVGTAKLLSNKLTINIDMGQRIKTFSAKNRKLVDENNKPIVFNSMVDAMNYMGETGWEFVQAYAITVAQSNVYHWLLKKDISKFSEVERAEILSGIKLNE